VQPPSVQEPVGKIILEEPTSDEKTFAVLAHALQLVGWFIAPLIILLLNSRSKFVRFHALQALFLQIAYMLAAGCIVMTLMITFFASLPAMDSKHPPIAIFLAFPVLWLGMMASYVLMLVLAIVFAVRAGRGEWAAYPLIGRLAASVTGVALP
jgi:uncharacterized protein